MRKKVLSLIITFDSTAAAMAAERSLQERGLPGRIIPVPQEITATCGLAWKAPVESEDLLKQQMQEMHLHFQGMYVLEV